MLRTTRSIVLLAALGACSRATRVEPVPASPPIETPPVASARPGPTTAVDLGFLAHLDADHTNVLVVGDAVPHLRRLLDSRHLEQVFADFPLPVSTFAPENMRATLDRVEPWLPDTVVLAVDDTFVRFAFQMVRSSVTGTACTAARQTSAATRRRDLPWLEEQLLADLHALAIPRMLIWGHMRDAEHAHQAFEVMAQVAARLPASVGTFERTPNTVHMVIDVSSLDRPAMADALRGMTNYEDPEDPEGDRMLDALSKLRVHIVIAWDDDTLRLTMAPDPSRAPKPPLRPEDLGPGFDPGSSTMVAWGRWDAGRLESLVDETSAFFERLEGTATYPAFQAIDIDNREGALRQVLAAFEASPPRGHLRIDVGEGIDIETVREDPPPAVPLDETGILALIPPGTAIVNVDGLDDMGNVTAEMLARIEDRVARSIDETATQGDATEPPERTLQRYYDDFEALRILVLREGPTLFEPPVAHVIVPSWPMARVSTRVELGPGASMALRVPIPELAIIGRPKSMPAARAWIDDTYAALVQGIHRRTTSQRRAPDEGLVTAVDLGIGAPTRALHLDWLQPLALAGPIETDPDVGVHYFEHEGFLVLSTSARLSRAVISNPHPRALPQPSLIGHGSIRGADVSSILLAFVDGLEPKGQATTSWVLVLDLLSQTVDEATWSTWDEGGVRRTKYALRWAEPD